MLDSRKYCPQCGGDQLTVRLPKNIVSWLLGLLLLSGPVFSAFSLVLILKDMLTGQRVSGEISLRLAQFILVYLMVVVLLIPVILFTTSRRVKNPKVYLLKCQQCGHQWRMTRDELRQAGDVPVQTKTLNSQEKQEKRATVEALLNQIKKM